MNETHENTPEHSRVDFPPNTAQATYEQLALIARGQVLVVAALQLHLLFIPFTCVLPWLFAPTPQGLASFERTYIVGFVLLAGFAIFSGYYLANSLFGRRRALLYGLGLFVSGLNIIILLVLSREATKRLQDSNLELGMFGLKRPANQPNRENSTSSHNDQNS